MINFRILSRKNSLKVLIKIHEKERFKGTVSGELRWVLLYANQKPFSRAGVADQKFYFYQRDTGTSQFLKNLPACVKLVNLRLPGGL